MEALRKWLEADRDHTVTMGTAGVRRFCRLQTWGRWHLDIKEFPFDAPRKQHFSVVGYGSTIEEAITDALKQLPE